MKAWEKDYIIGDYVYMYISVKLPYSVSNIHGI